MLEKLFRPVAAIALTLGLSASVLAAEPLKIGTTSLLPFRWKPPWKKRTSKAWK